MTTIITHSGRFHCDEVFAVASLNLMYPDACIVRTRNVQELQQWQQLTQRFMVDVGLIYDPTRNLYDHHQAKIVDVWSSSSSLEEPQTEQPVPLSSFGMVWKHHGKQLLALYTNDAIIIDTLYERLYTEWVRPIDANDNGIVITKQTSLPAIIGSFNDLDLDENNAFMAAMNMAMTILSAVLTSNVRYLRVQAEQKVLLYNALTTRVHPEIIVLNEPIDSLKLLRELDPELSVKFAVVPSNGEWRIKTVETPGQKFVPLKRLLPKDVLSVQVPDVVFVHATGFTGGASSMEGAFNMALLSARDLTTSDQ